MSKVYLETLRDGYEADGETRKAARDYFPQRKPGWRKAWHTAGESTSPQKSIVKRRLTFPLAEEFTWSASNGLKPGPGFLL